MRITQLEYRVEPESLTKLIIHLRIGVLDVRNAFDSICQKLKEKSVVPGFRKGNAPLALIRKHHRAEVKSKAFDKLKRAAMDQVFQQLDKTEQPMLPPKVVKQEDVQINYLKGLEFSIEYYIDPSALNVGHADDGTNTESERLTHDNQMGINQPIGVPAGPSLPDLNHQNFGMNRASG